MKNLFVYAVFCSIFLSSCALFKKNKCQECPKWNNIEQIQDEHIAHADDCKED